MLSTLFASGTVAKILSYSVQQTTSQGTNWGRPLPEQGRSHVLLLFTVLTLSHPLSLVPAGSVLPILTCHSAVKTGLIFPRLRWQYV